MHEILTLQLGQRSNYLATHFWNIQESYFTYPGEPESIVDHDIHFRQGLGADGSETFTPRTVIYDLKGGFGSLKKMNALYEMQEEAGMQQDVWSGPAVVERQAAIEQSLYQKSLDDGTAPPRLTTQSVRYWSDFNRVFYHPRSIVQLNEYELHSALMPFESWSVGEDLFSNLDKEHDLLDRDLRPFAEEADQMQGIQLLASTDDAWGGFAARYIERLRDEYGKTTVWFWGIEDCARTMSREKHLLKMSNTARSLSEITAQASVFIPMTLPLHKFPPYVTLDRASAWHTSALLVTAWESMTLSSRLKHNTGHQTSLDGIAAALNINGNQNIGKLQMSIGSKVALHREQEPDTFDARTRHRDPRVPAQSSQIITEDREEELTDLDMTFFPNEDTLPGQAKRSTKRTHTFGRAESYRDVEEPDHQNDEYDGQQRARRRAANLPIIHKAYASLPFPILDSFPSIYSPTLASPTSESVAVSTSLSTDTSVALKIKNVRSIVARSVGVEERENISNSLGEIAEAYEEGWDSGSDEDDD